MKLPGFRSPRGQALTETAIALPLFLMGLFGVIWAVREGAMSERVQLGVRYGGMLGQMSNPYQDYSLYSVYATIQGGPPTSYQNCTGGQPTMVTGTRKSFFAPLDPPSPDCYGGLVFINNPPGAYSEPIMLQDNAALLTSDSTTGGFLGSVFGADSTSNYALQNFFKSPDVESLTQCTTVGNVVYSAAFGYQDETSATAAPSPLPTALLGVTVIPTGAVPSPCPTFTPPPGPTASPSPTPSPTHSPTPTPGPTATATWTPSASPTAVPTPTIAPTWTPSASPSPTPTLVVTAAPTPSPTWTPSASPSPTPTWTPSATPTASASPTSAPTPTPSPTVPPTPTPTPTFPTGYIF